MQKLIILPFFLLLNYNSFAQAVSMYISASPISCSNYDYEIELTYFGEPVSNLAINGPIMFGDGTHEDFNLNDNYYYQEIAGRIIRKYKFHHTFPGPGSYKIQFRSFNRNANIVNMTNSINTPFYIETEIIIDPFLGCNTTPKLENMLFYQKTGLTYNQNFSFHDNENDSISYQLSIPLQDDSVEVIDYWFPKDFDQLNNPISKILLDPLNGTVALSGASLKGNYAVALEINEWRKLEGQYYIISRTVFDFNMFFYETENNPPIISIVQDTAIVVGEEVKFKIKAEDPENNPILFSLYGDLFYALNLFPEDPSDFIQGPITKEISFTPNYNDVRDGPYKLISTARDGALDASQTNYIWITDKPHKPDSVKFFTTIESNPGKIKLEWIDVDDELGYIIERSDTYFPDFYRVAVLPADAIIFIDSSVVNGNTYRYRIKAVGTTMSPYKTVEVSTTDIITSLVNQEKSQQLRVFPNPSSGTFNISNPSKIKTMEIHDISGKVVFRKAFDNASNYKGPINISTGLRSGIYVIAVEFSGTFLSKKILVN
jgi:hypothetical protein